MFAHFFTPYSKYAATVLIALSAVGLLMSIQGCAPQAAQFDRLQTAPPAPLLSSPPTFSERQAALSAREAQISSDYTYAQQVCYGRFFVNQCLEKAHARYQQEKTALRIDQLAFEDAQRAQRVRERRRQERSSVAPLHTRSATGARMILRGQTRAQQLRDMQQRAENVRRFEAKQATAKRHRLLMEHRRESRKRACSAPAANNKRHPGVTPTAVTLPCESS